MRIKLHNAGILAILALLVALAGCNQKPGSSDAQIASAVQNKIYSDAAVQSRTISIQAAEGVVTLSGNVGNDAERGAAANDAAAVSGVRTVVNNLVVQQAQVAPAPPEPAAAEPVQRAVSPPRLKAAPARTAYHGAGRSQARYNEIAQNGAPPATTTPVQPPAQMTPPPPPPPPAKVTIPAGTQLTVRLSDPLDSERNHVGDTFHGTLGAPIVVDDQTVIPLGADVIGRVADVKSAGRFAGNSVLTLELTSLGVNGRSYNVQTSQWSRAGKGEGKNTAVKAGGGAALGALIGGLAGGGKGAAIGAAAGGATGTGVAATKKGEQIKLSPESTLNFQLINTLTMTPQGDNNRNAGRTPLDQ
jgi:hypothetical protein